MSKKTKEALVWIIRILRKKKIPYQITGGLAARLYGSTRPLADIDIEIHDKDIKKIFPHVKDYVVNGPLHYVDHQFDIYGVFLKYKGQSIDICGTDTQKVFNKPKNKKTSKIINLKKAIRKKVYGLSVKLVPLKDLIDYKKRLARKVDLEDIKQLTKN